MRPLVITVWSKTPWWWQMLGVSGGTTSGAPAGDYLVDSDGNKLTDENGNRLTFGT